MVRKIAGLFWGTYWEILHKHTKTWWKNYDTKTYKDNIEIGHVEGESSKISKVTKEQELVNQKLVNKNS